MKRLMALIVCAVVLGTASVAAIALLIFERNVSQRTLQELEHTAQGVNTILEDWKLTLKGVANVTAKRPDVCRTLDTYDIEGLQELIDDISDMVDIEIVAVTDARGVVIVGDGENIERGVDLAANAAVSAAIAGDECYDYTPIGEVAFALVYAAPVRVSGILLGTVLMAYDLSCGDFSEMINECFDVECSLYSGTELAETSLDLEKGDLPVESSVLASVLKSGETSTGKGLIAGERYFTVLLPIVGAGDENRGLVFVAKSISVISRVRSRVLLIVIPYTLLIVFAFAAIIFYTIMKMLRSNSGLGRRLVEETKKLAESSRQNASTAQDQSAAVKEIVATMEDNNALAENISCKIKDVSSVAVKTRGDVAEGVSCLEENVRQLREIFNANCSTIDGIKNLSEKITNIWDMVTLINSVADQAKIIAFNAELEASSAGEAGKNFHIVATEIRRLADGIIDGTKEIKERINEIQQSSDSLVLASESGTEKIKAGVENARNLEERFASIKDASELTAGSAGDISTIIQQQAMASEQILITLRQIAGGAESFSGATKDISIASENLRGIAEELGG